MSTLYVVEKWYEGSWRWNTGKTSKGEWKPVSNLRPRAEKAKAVSDLETYKVKHGKNAYYQADFKFRVVEYKRAAVVSTTEKRKKAKKKKKAAARS